MNRFFLIHCRLSQARWCIWIICASKIMHDIDQDKVSLYQEGSTLWAVQTARLLWPTRWPLKSLELVETRFIDDDAVNGLVESLAAHGASLNRIGVIECNLVDEQLGALIGGIVQCLENNPDSFSLESLDISFNKGGGSVTNQLSSLLQASKLKKLAMGFQAFGEGRRIDLSPLFLSIRQNQYLRELDISGNGIRDVDVSLLVDCLVENRGIEVLDLSQNRFTNDGLRVLARNFIRMPRLVHILLEDIRDMNQESISILADAILSSNNYTMHTIEVAASLMEGSTWSNLTGRLDRNWSGLYEFQDENGEINIALPLWPMFAERLCHPHRHGLANRIPDAASILYHLIPHVCIIK